jgi:hypothetical protein
MVLPNKLGVPHQSPKRIPAREILRRDDQPIEDAVLCKVWVDNAHNRIKVRLCQAILRLNGGHTSLIVQIH